MKDCGFPPVSWTVPGRVRFSGGRRSVSHKARSDGGPRPGKPNHDTRIPFTIPDMNRSNRRFTRGRKLQVISLFAASACSGFLAVSASAQTPYPSASGEKLLFESSGAARLVEKVRSKSQGVMMEVFVKPGDTVKKGQLLGHTELDQTKLQLELAKNAYLSKANVESAKNQAEAWTVNREETEEAVRRRKMEPSRLDWASAMEKMYQASYENQLDAETTQQIQYDFWKDQYQKRFFRSPVDGVVAEVLVDVGKPVNFATHLFTIANDGTYSLPVRVPASVADAVSSEETVPVRSADGKAVCNARVDSVTEDPRENGMKVVRLLVKVSDFPAAVRSKLSGMKFDVLMPHADVASIQ